MIRPTWSRGASSESMKARMQREAGFRSRRLCALMRNVEPVSWRTKGVILTRHHPAEARLEGARIQTGRPVTPSSNREGRGEAKHGGCLVQNQTRGSHNRQRVCRPGAGPRGCASIKMPGATAAQRAPPPGEVDLCDPPRGSGQDSGYRGIS